MERRAPPKAPEVAFKLPLLVFGLTEVRRLVRECEALEDYMQQARLREPGTAQKLPKISRLLDEVAQQNDRNLLQANDREAIRLFLLAAAKNAPVLHFSFASDPSAAFLAKLVAWLRANVHQNALVSLGLQPSIAAGCIVRTHNKSFDFSLRQHLADKHHVLIQSLTQGGSPPATEASHER